MLLSMRFRERLVNACLLLNQPDVDLVAASADAGWIPSWRAICGGGACHIDRCNENVNNNDWRFDMNQPGIGHTRNGTSLTRQHLLLGNISQRSTAGGSVRFISRCIPFVGRWTLKVNSSVSKKSQHE